jgi:solute carrier family 25 carnitine/acylcarnitine transporter 20/29
VTALRDTAYGPYFLVYEYVARGGDFGTGLGSGSRRHVKADLAAEVESELFGTADGQAGASTMRVLVAGGLAGIAGWGATYVSLPDR